MLTLILKGRDDGYKLQTKFTQILELSLKYFKAAIIAFSKA